MTNDFTPKNARKFSCKDCHFECSKRSDWSRHISTQKHKIRTNTNDFTPKNAKQYHCNCGKKYKHASSLWNHKQSCQHTEDNLENVKSIFMQAVTKISDAIKIQLDSSCNDTGLMQQMLKQMQDQQSDLRKRDELLEQMIQKMGNTTTINANNSNNSFNVNMFLNEQCKDAINFSDFIDNISVSHEDLQNNAELGFVNGISKIFLDNLKQLSIFERPIHCTDVKREILYIKDNEEWNKDNEEKEKMKLAIHKLKQNHLYKLSDWVHDNPGCEQMDNPKNDLLLNMIREHATYDDKNIKKVIKSIAQNVTIPKNYNAEISYV